MRIATFLLSVFFAALLCSVGYIVYTFGIHETIVNTRSSVEESPLAVEVKPSPSPPVTSLRSSFSCLRTADWVDICQYDVLCFDGYKLVMLRPDLFERQQFEEHNRGGLESVMWEPQ